MIENEKIDCIDSLIFGLNRTAQWRQKMAVPMRWNSTTAPVVTQADTTVGDGSNLKSHTAKALESLEQAIEEHGQRVPDASPDFPDDVPCVS
jgi:hypothetical protein